MIISMLEFIERRKEELKQDEENRRPAYRSQVQTGHQTKTERTAK